MNLPPIADPERYAGLYVYDFGTHTAVGYTSSEVRILRESKEYRHGTAYEIYRVSEDGEFELRGVLDHRLSAREALCFLRADEAAARGDYEALRQAADQTPVPAAVELQLARVRAFSPPHVTAMLYAASASSVVANWLTQTGFAGGDRAIGGMDVYVELTSSDRAPISACTLPALMSYRNRPAEEVVSAVKKPLQR
jgi:hypothetical protein